MSFEQEPEGHRFGSAIWVNQRAGLSVYPDWLWLLEDKDGNVTLVVVDMQPGFQDAIDKATLDAVERQIKLAISRNWAIVVLENEPWRNGHTYPQLMVLLKNKHGQKYGRYKVKVKADDDGSRQVIKACREFGYPLAHFRACGVYLDACVEKTVFGLTRRLPDCSVRVVREACNTNYGHEDAWKALCASPRVTVSSEQGSCAPLVTECGAQVAPCGSEFAPPVPVGLLLASD